MDVKGKRLRRFATFAIIGVLLAFSVAWGNGILIPGELPGTGIDWLITSQSQVMATGGNGELGLHVVSPIVDAVGDDDDSVEVYGYKVGESGEYELDGTNLLVVRTNGNSLTLQNVTVSNDSSGTFGLSNLEIIPDWGTFAGFDTPGGNQETGNWTFNVTHRGFHTLFDPGSQEPLPFLLAKVEESNFVELAYNPFGEPVEATIGPMSESSSGLQTAAGLETDVYPYLLLPRRYAASGMEIDLGTIFLNQALIVPATPGSNFEMAITNWGSEPIELQPTSLDKVELEHAFFLLDPSKFTYTEWPSTTSCDLPPAFSFRERSYCQASIDGEPTPYVREFKGMMPGESSLASWKATFNTKAYQWLARFSESSMEATGVMPWDGLDLVYFTIPSADLEGKEALYPYLVGSLPTTVTGDYPIDRVNLVVSHDEGPVDGFAGDVRFLEMNVPYSSLVPVAEGETVPVLPLRIRMDLTTEGSEELPEAVADAIQAIAEDVADDVPFDQAFLERFHIWAVLSDGQIVDLVEAAEEAGLDPTNVIRLMGTAMLVPGGITTTQMEEAATVLYCRGQLFGAVVDDGPAGVSFSNGAVIIHDGGNTGDPAFTAKIVLAPVSARETPEGESGGGCNGAGALPLGLFLLVPLALLRSRS
ncbi:MAG: M20 family metallo-hydrolase [Synergistaceae bacterium]|nr:M20 family metallo-hydrolase [Synergistaceae bacterium]